MDLYGQSLVKWFYYLYSETVGRCLFNTISPVLISFPPLESLYTFIEVEKNTYSLYNKIAVHITVSKENA